MSLLVAVVTRRTGVTLTLGSKSHHLVEIRPVGDWLDRSWVEDVIVLDLETGDATSAAVERLRLMDTNRPIVVIAAEGVPWEELTIQYPDMFVVPLPITASTLLDTVDRAMAASRAVRVTPPAPRIEGPPQSMRGPEPVAATTTMHGDPLAPSYREPYREAGRRRMGADSAPTTSLVPLAPPEAPQGVPAMPRPTPVASSVHPEAAPGLAIMPQMNMVRALLLEVSLLPRVAETAGVVISRATEAVAADAAAVLVPDDGAWRVEAGSGLRPLEERLQIDATHWLITEVAVGRRGLLIKNTDVARNQLAGAPLASWANLLAVPVAGDVFLLLAREHSAFSRDDLTHVAGAVAGLDAPMNDAIDVRRLARKMIDYLDLVE